MSKVVAIAAHGLFMSSDFAFHQPQQLRRFHPEAAGEVKKRVQGRALLATFQLPDVVPVVACLVGEGVFTG